MIYLKLSDLWKAKQTTPTEICAFFKPRCQDESHKVTMSSCRVTSCAECRDCLRSAAKHGSLRSWIPVGWFTKCNLSALAKQIPREKEHVQCFRVVYSGLEWFISIFSKFSQFQVVSMLVTSSHPMVFDRWTNRTAPSAPVELSFSEYQLFTESFKPPVAWTMGMVPYIMAPQWMGMVKHQSKRRWTPFLQFANLKMTIEIVSCPIKNGDFPYFFVNVYQWITHRFSVILWL